MKQRNPFAVFALPFVTFGIYSLYWEVSTKNEMKALGAEIPTAWLLIIPFVNLYWLWKYSQGVEQVTGGKQSAALVFVLLALLSMIGAAIVQSEFNKINTAPTFAGSPATNPGQQPDTSFGGPVNSAPVQPAIVAPQPTAASYGSASVAPTYSDPTNSSQPPSQTPPTV